LHYYQVKSKPNFLNYLYGSTTKIWSRLVWENPSIVLSRAKFIQSCSSSFPPSAHLDFGLPWFHLPSGLALNRALFGITSYHESSVAQSIGFLWHRWHLCCWTPYRVRNWTYSCTQRLLFLGHISFQEPSS
jgi:hypothetical protein